MISTLLYALVAVLVVVATLLVAVLALVCRLLSMTQEAERRRRASAGRRIDEAGRW